MQIGLNLDTEHSCWENNKEPLKEWKNSRPPFLFNKFLGSELLGVSASSNIIVCHSTRQLLAIELITNLGKNICLLLRMVGTLGYLLRNITVKQKRQWGNREVPVSTNRYGTYGNSKMGIWLKIVLSSGCYVSKPGLKERKISFCWVFFIIHIGIRCC